MDSQVFDGGFSFISIVLRVLYKDDFVILDDHLGDCHVLKNARVRMDLPSLTRPSGLKKSSFLHLIPAGSHALGVWLQLHLTGHCEQPEIQQDRDGLNQHPLGGR